MAVITALKPQKNNKRVNVYLDGKYSFGIDLENLMKLGLKVEQNLSQDEIGSIISQAEYQKSLDKLVNYAMTRPRSKREIFSWFARKKIHESLRERLLNKISEYELVDDEKFTRWWVDQRQQFRPRSERQLRQELLQKGIAKDLITTVLSENEIDETKIARDLISQKSYKWDKYNEKTAKQKKSEFLARKGFTWDVIKEVV